jgi:hypothetical protein
MPADTAATAASASTNANAEDLLDCPDVFRGLRPTSKKTTFDSSVDVHVPAGLPSWVWDELEGSVEESTHVIDTENPAESVSIVWHEGNGLDVGLLRDDELDQAYVDMRLFRWALETEYRRVRGLGEDVDLARELQREMEAEAEAEVERAVEDTPVKKRRRTKK